MPRLSDSMEEGTIVRWLRADGDAVARGEEIVEIETDKATMAYESEYAGTLHVLAGEGDTLTVGAPIAQVLAADEALAPSAPAPVVPAPPEPVGGPNPHIGGSDGPTVAVGAVAAAQGDRPKASPLARRLASERGVELTALQGTGPGGRIVRADVEAAAATTNGHTAAPPAPASPPPSPISSPAEASGAKGETTTQPLSRLQQVVARRMAEAKATVPEFALTVDVDMDAAVVLRAELKAAAPEGAAVPSYNDMVVKACALALREHPRANGSYRDGRLRPARPRQRRHRRRRSRRARRPHDRGRRREVSRRDRPREPCPGRQGPRRRPDPARALRRHLHGVEPRHVGVTQFTAVINPPQAAILAVGAVEQRAVVRDGAVVTGQVMTVTLTSDHRILYGADAAPSWPRSGPRSSSPFDWSCKEFACPRSSSATPSATRSTRSSPAMSG